jgi:NitT/TauT family transport system permease protein
MAKNIEAAMTRNPDRVAAREPAAARGSSDKTRLRQANRWWESSAGIIALQISSVVGFIILWLIVAEIPRAIRIPTPGDVLESAVSLDFPKFLHDCWLSFYRVGLGFLIAAIVGIPLGILIGSSFFARNLLFPTVEVLRPIPPIAWIPLGILFFPQVEWMIIFLTFYGAFFPIVYNTISGVAGIPLAYIRAGKSLGASQWTLFWHVMVPAMLPSIFTGLYIAIGIAWLMVVAGEMVAITGGVGGMTWQAYQTTRYPLIFVGMAAIGILGYLSSLLVRLLARAVIRWEAL